MHGEQELWPPCDDIVPSPQGWQEALDVAFRVVEKVPAVQAMQLAEEAAPEPVA